MFDTVTFRVTRPLIEVGSPIHTEGKASDTADSYFFAEGGDGSEVHLRYGMIYKGPDAHVRVSKYGVFITTSLARKRPYAGPNIEPPCTSEVCLSRMVDLTDSMAQVGLFFDPMEAGLSRVDLFKDVRLGTAYQDLASAIMGRGFQVMSPSDASKILPFGEENGRRGQGDVQHHTYGVWTKRRAFVVYNKLAHLASKKGVKSYSSDMLQGLGGDCLVRFECRYFGADAVRSSLGIKAGADLVNYWDLLEGRYLDVVAHHFGPQGSAGLQNLATWDEGEDAPSEGSAPGSDFAATLQVAMETFGNGKRALLLALASWGLQASMDHGLDDAALRALFLASGARLRDVRGIWADLEAIVEVNGERTRTDVIAELFQALRGDSFKWPGRPC